MTEDQTGTRSAQELSIPMAHLAPRLEGADPDAVPPYMTQPDGPRHTSHIEVCGQSVPVEVVIERGVGWIRWQVHGSWRLWRRMDGPPSGESETLRPGT